MHRLATTPGGWNPDHEGVVFVEQTPAPIVILTAADTDIQTLAIAVDQLPLDFPAIRVTNLLHLQQYLSIDTYVDTVLSLAEVIIVRLLGGQAYWSYGLERLQELAETTQIQLFILPGDDRPDPTLISHSTVPLTDANQLWRYLVEGGVANLTNALKFVADRFLGKPYHFSPPQRVPLVGFYCRSQESGFPERQPTGVRSQESTYKGDEDAQIETLLSSQSSTLPPIGILFYRAHYLSGNTAPIDAVCQALSDRNLQPVPVFVSSLRDSEIQAEVQTMFQPKAGAGVDLILNTTSFAIGSPEQPTSLWSQLNVPVLQVILSSSTVEQWQTQWRGLTPRDIAMNVALPEVDGRIITRAVSFKSVQTRNARLETDVVTYEPVDDRIQFVAELAANWVKLRRTPIADRKIALILANYPTRDGRLANGVGLDTPASVIELLQALQQAGYTITNPPTTTNELMQRLTTSMTNDPEGQHLRSTQQALTDAEYIRYFENLPEAVRRGIRDRWENLDIGSGEWGVGSGEEKDVRQEVLLSPQSSIPISGLQLGNVFVGIQPARGYDRDPSLSYHAPDLEPTHNYLAFYEWLRSQFGVQAIVHVGKHGNLEWLPGKSIALSENCYPEVALGALPHFYPFIVNDPGEGSQAKRRSHAVIIDHLTPPMTRAELYGSLQQLEALIDEYYDAQSLDPSRLEVIRDRIVQLLQTEHFDWDLAVRTQPSTRIPESSPDFSSNESWLDRLSCIDGYLCELKEAQIRDGLHIFGNCPQGQQLRDLIIAIARSPGQGRLGLIRAIAQDWGFDFDPLTADPALPCPSRPFSPPPRTIGAAIDLLEHHAAHLVDQLLITQPPPPRLPPSPSPLQLELHWITTHLLPTLQQTTHELTHLLRGLNGEFVPPGASGAPTRGRPEVLPTGRNFYSIDIRAIPTETAWDVGRKAAAALIERHVQEQGEFPQTIGLSIWGTSTMRTGGDDIAEALALLGVQPVWDGMARRVIDFEVVPLSILGRPRVDVTLRISGFFRDAFANLIDLFDQAVATIAALDEPPEQNPLAAQVRQDAQDWQQQGLSPEQAAARSHYRIFGSKPGAYGAGLQGLIESQAWTDDADLARAYINWSSYAYTGQGIGHSAPEAFSQRLRQMQIVLHNQDNREHDLLDSDDYYQFQGGLTAAVRSLTGHNPHTYFGDHSRPEQPKVRRLQEEIGRVYRSRVVNPKWIAGVMRHGYKGAFELAATVDYLFAYDATAHCVEDFMYQGIADAYVFDSTVQTFVQQHNPWALRDMAERLLEAHQRGFWQSVNPQTIDYLKAIANQAEGAIETRL